MTWLLSHYQVKSVLQSSRKLRFVGSLLNQIRTAAQQESNPLTNGRADTWREDSVTKKSCSKKKMFTKTVEDVWSLSVVPGDKTKQNKIAR